MVRVYKAMLVLHLLTAIFAIGPLVGAVTTASRGLRTADATATTSAARIVTIYSYASVLVVIFGFGLMSSKPPWAPEETVASFSELWIWLSTLLWFVAVAVALFAVVPALEAATEKIGAGDQVSTLTGRAGRPGWCGRADLRRDHRADGLPARQLMGSGMIPVPISTRSRRCP